MGHHRMNINNRLSSICFYLFVFFGAIQVVHFFYASADAVECLVPQVKSYLPHDSTAFTQGLVVHNNELYESTGLYGQSTLRHINLKTGQIIKKISLPPFCFGEGIAATDQSIVQVTWKENKIFIYDRMGFKPEKVLIHEGEGWGLCSDGESFFMSHGTSKITVHDPVSWKTTREFDVHLNEKKINYLNDLECVGEFIYANVWKTDTIVRLNKFTGEVTGLIDTSNLLTKKEKISLGVNDVLNGIAYNPETKTFWITGKRWPWLFEVNWIRGAE
jgi:glutamine cyclotransferase